MNIWITLVSFFNSTFFISLVTGAVGSVAIVKYFKQRNDYKKDVAKSILQEIRWAENIIGKYKEFRNYKFTQKIIPTNSWANNMHLFVDNLTPDQIDKIGDFYSTGEYLDTIVNKISNVQFDKNAELFFKFLENQPVLVQANQVPEANVGRNRQPQYQNVIPPWQFLLDEISLRYEPILHSTVVTALKKIAKTK